LRDPRTGALILNDITPVERMEMLIGVTPLRVSQARDLHAQNTGQQKELTDRREYFTDQLAQTRFNMALAFRDEGIRSPKYQAGQAAVQELQKRMAAEGIQWGPILKDANVQMRQMWIEQLRRDYKKAPKSLKGAEYERYLQQQELH